ncbi:YceI-like domain-containing protein [Chitinophaga dinghuensis]|uniref:YceI-like domain-containing protein n=1 Tax=Chitinophaga dinghuensis TaxID=1539050 RepID=A0A327VMS2_9BACT|nr:YceI family protein [Chitinophaga dinghuensis]RAJ75113.1 YceI-like domain-containing protein [Chitinophaga dinghuensis]
MIENDSLVGGTAAINMHPVTFPAKIQVKDGIVEANGKLVIDRTQWGIRYRSGKFYDNLADQAVWDEVELLMKVVAKDK